MYAIAYVLISQGIFGNVTPPPGVATFNANAGSAAQNIGLFGFISNLVKLISIIAGLFALFNVMGAGFTYLNSSGNAKATEQAMQQLTNSLIGLAVIVGSFGITGVVSLILFGDAMFILNPDIPTP